MPLRAEAVEQRHLRHGSPAHHRNGLVSPEGKVGFPKIDRSLSDHRNPILIESGGALSLAFNAS